MGKSLLQILDEEFGLGLQADQTERRDARRRPCVAPVILVPIDERGELDEDGRRDGIAVDVSEHGMRVVSRSLLEARSLQVRIPKAAGGRIELFGEVVRRRDLRSGYREYGLRLAST